MNITTSPKICAPQLLEVVHQANAIIERELVQNLKLLRFIARWSWNPDIGGSQWPRKDGCRRSWKAEPQQAAYPRNEGPPDDAKTVENAVTMICSDVCSDSDEATNTLNEFQAMVCAVVAKSLYHGLPQPARLGLKPDAGGIRRLCFSRVLARPRVHTSTVMSWQHR
jgi:hypothetical protein